MKSILDIKILVVDDMAVMRKIMQKVLNALGFNNILTAQDGKIASEVLESEFSKGSPIDVVISDWNMPHMTGIDLLKYCRSSKVLNNIGFVMVTAEIEAAQQQLAKDEGVDAYITKPVAENIFKEILESVCNTRAIK